MNEQKRRRLAELAELEGICATTTVEAGPLVALGRTYLELGMLEQAISALERSLRAPTDTDLAFQGRMLQARALVLSHAPWPDVLEHYLTAHADDPTRPEPLGALAQAYAERALDGPAYLFAKRALELDARGGPGSLDGLLRTELAAILARVGPTLDPPSAPKPKPARKRIAKRPAKAKPKPKAVKRRVQPKRSA